MRINPKQSIVLGTSAAIVAAMLIYPPFHLIGAGGAQRSLGYAWIFSPPTTAAIVNTSLLFIQWIGVSIVGTVLYILVANPSGSSLPKSPATEREEGISPRQPLVTQQSTDTSRIWYRFWARCVDYALFIFLVIALSLFWGDLSFSKNAFIEIAASLIVINVMLVLFEACFITLTATTPGKFLFGIRVVDTSGQRLTFGASCHRTIWVLARGFAFLLFFPVVPLIAAWTAHNHIKANGIALWDQKKGHQVIHRHVGALRVGIGIALGIVSIFLITLMHVAYKQVARKMLKEPAPFNIHDFADPAPPIRENFPKENTPDFSSYGEPVRAPESEPITAVETEVDLAHPGWRTLVKTAEFGEWRQKQPERIKKLGASEKAEDAILMLDIYKRDTKTGSGVAESSLWEKFDAEQAAQYGLSAQEYRRRSARIKAICKSGDFVDLDCSNDVIAGRR